MTTILGVIALLVILIGILSMIWNALEITYRVIMITLYSIAYVAISLYEVIAFVVRLIFRITSTLIRFLTNSRCTLS